jgi:opacity protein-like surface antigen
MKLSRILVSTLMFLALIVPSASLAQDDSGAASSDAVADEPDYARPGPYMQVGLVQAWGQFKDPTVPSRVGINLAVGGRFIQYAAAELDFEGVPNWSIYGRETTTYAIMANGKGYFPIGRFQPFVLAGIGTLISEQGNDHIARFAYRFGGGLDVFLTESIYLSASYRYTGNLDDFGYTNMLYLVGYHFD